MTHIQDIFVTQKTAERYKNKLKKINRIPSETKHGPWRWIHNRNTEPGKVTIIIKTG